MAKEIKFEIPDALIPEMETVAHEAGVNSLEDYFRSLMLRGFKQKMIDKTIANHIGDVQSEVNTKLSQIEIVSATSVTPIPPVRGG